VDRNIFWRANFRYLVLVYRPGDCAARALRADEGHAKAGTIFAGFLKILPVFLLVLPGIIAFALFPDQVKKPDYAYPTLVLNLLPVAWSDW